MLLNALWSPEVHQQTSAYVTRAPEAAGLFLYGVGIMSIVIFVFAVLASSRVPAQPPK